MRVSACASVCRCGGEARKSAEGGGGGTSVAAIHRTEGWKGKGSAPSTARRGRRPGSCSPAILSPSHLRPPSSAPPAASGGPWPSSARCLGKGKEREREVERVRDEGEPSAPSAFFSLRAPASSCTLLCLASGARDSAPSSFAGGCARGCARGTHRHPWLCVPCAVEKGAKKGKCMYARSASPPAHTFLPSLFTYDKKIEEVARDATTRHHDPSITPDTGRMPVLPQAAVTEAAVAHH